MTFIGYTLWNIYDHVKFHKTPPFNALPSQFKPLIILHGRRNGGLIWAILFKDWQIGLILLFTPIRYLFWGQTGVKTESFSHGFLWNACGPVCLMYINPLRKLTDYNRFNLQKLLLGNEKVNRLYLFERWIFGSEDFPEHY